LAAGALVAAACGGGESASTTTTTSTTSTTILGASADGAPAPTRTGSPVSDSLGAPGPTSEPTTSTTVPAVDRFDWANLTYASECGTATELPLVDGLYRPDDQNSNDQVLEVELQGADPLGPHLADVLVHLTCRAGGVGAELSSELYFVMHAVDEPRQDLVIVAEPSATHAIDLDGVVTIDDLTHGPNDPSCCPSVNRTRQIRWQDETPIVTDGLGPTEPPDATAPRSGCVGTELSLDSTDIGAIDRLETALAAAGFDPGPLDGRIDELTIAAVVQLIEVHADDPAMHADTGSPGMNLHAEAAQRGHVRAPVLRVLGIACEVVERLPA
jgi:hypothetical protein